MTRPGRLWRAASREDRRVFIALAVLLLWGAALRAAVMAKGGPAFLGYPDSFFYVGSAADELFSDPGHTAGYGVFLRVLHAIDPHLLSVVAVQHLFGLVTAGVLFLVVRHAGVRGWPSLLPAAVILLAGPVIYLEHAPATEALFALLQAGAIYAAVRAARGAALPWAAVAGALAGLTVLIRPIALVLLIAIAGLLLASGREGWRRRLALPAAAAVPALVLLGCYMAVQHGQTGRSDLVQAGGWFTYARAATFANCDEFTPPPGTAHLCQTIDPSQRRGPNSYIFAIESPAVQAYHKPSTAPASANAELKAFGRAAMIHQPLDYLGQVVTEELPRYVWSGRFARPDQGMDFDLLADTLVTPATPDMVARVKGYYSDADEIPQESELGGLRTYERATRVNGPASVALMVLALAGVALGRGPARAVAAFLAVVAFGSMAGSALTLFYDARYAIVTWGPLAAGAGIGLAAAVARSMELFARRGPQPV